MTRTELLALISEIQYYQSELDNVEVKSAHKGTPQRLYEPLSAFANRSTGGVILFGLNEKKDFEVVGVGNPHRLQEEIGNLVSSSLEPSLRIEFTIEEVQGKTVVAVEVPPVSFEMRPCYYKPAGLQKGSYIRVGNTNRQMTDYEIFGYLSARTQPTFDEEPEKDATLEDLDRIKLEAYTERLKQSRPQATYLNKPFEQILAQLRVIKKLEGMLYPTLAGLLMFGSHPQVFEPQLVITYLHYYGTTETEKTPRGERFLDNRKFEGSIPEMVDNAVNYIMASIRKGSLIKGLYREDVPEYPQEAVREAVINAIAHRDYSNFVRGSYIQIRQFADRLEIQSPGGLYGNVTEETLEQEQSTRNRTLMRLMEDSHLVENRGSGIGTMLESMRKANLEPPRFTDKRSSFWVILKNINLMNKNAINWLNNFAGIPLNDRQRLAMVYLKHNSKITNREYQRLNHIDSVNANRELRSLVQIGLAEQHETKRWAYYTLSAKGEDKKKAVFPPKSAEGRVLEYVCEHGYIKRGDCVKLLNVSEIQAKYLLVKMRDKGFLKQQGTRKATLYVLSE